MQNLPRVHWVYGCTSISVANVVEEETKKRDDSYVIIDYDVIKRKYFCRFATFLGSKYMGEETAIIENFCIYTRDKFELSRIKKLFMLFSPHVCRLQLVDHERWKVRDIYVVSVQSPGEFYDSLPAKMRPSTKESFINMFYSIRHMTRVIELAI